MSQKTSLNRKLIAFGSAGALAVGTLALAASPAQAEGNILGTDNPDAISGSYLVTLNDEMSAQSVESLAESFNGEITSQWSLINGFAVEMSEADAKQLAADSSVDYIEQNGVFTIADEGVQENPPSWGLDRIDQEELPLDDLYHYPNQGSGVTAYILDTGINLQHEEFADRLVEGYDVISPGGDADDCNGHGTHVAGTVGGTDTGVAKNVSLSPVRVLDCGGSGSFDGIIDGIEWATQDASGPAVSNMSLGGQYTQTVNDAVDASVAAGLTNVVASGNDSSDACNYSPASAQGAISVNSSESNDSASGFTNFGSCTDFYAPGGNIYAPWIGGSNAYNTISGTSMASPHGAGVAAQYLAANPDAGPDEIRSELVSNATEGVISNPNGDNLLLNNSFIGSGDPDDGFSVSVDPSSGEIDAGESVTATIETETTTGDAQEVSLSHSGAGDDVTVDFADETLTTGESTEVTFTAEESAADEAHSISLTATGDVERSATFDLTVGEEEEPSDCISENTASQALPAINFTTSNVSIDCADAGSTVTVNIDASGNTADMMYSLVSPNGTFYQLKNLGEADQGTYSIDVGGTAASGSYTLETFNLGMSDGTLNGWSVEV